MPIYLKILVFLVAEFVIVALLHAFPRSGASRAAWAWHGPFPEDGETRAHYRLRRATWVATLLCQLVVILFAGAAIIRAHPALAGGTFEHVMMALTGLGWVAVGCILWYVGTAIKALVFGPNPVYEVHYID